jgi:Tol biopolymer transport system component
MPETADETTGMRARELRHGQRAEVWTASRDGGAPKKVFETTEVLVEAPNWTPDGTALLLNGAGLLWRLPLDEPRLEPIEIADLPPINNDHVVAPDGRTIYLSGMDGHIHRAPLTGGTAERVTEDDGTLHFLHGVSPDGERLAYVSLPVGGFGSAGRLQVMPASGGPGRELDTGAGHLDGPEYSPDGAWLYCNSESFTPEEPGHAQLVRLHAEGGPLERLVASDTVDWFPHVSPDGGRATYVSFPSGTQGHPADLPVEVRLVDTADWTTPLAVHAVFGGQGTLNVNSWSPDGARFAFVAYPLG